AKSRRSGRIPRPLFNPPRGWRSSPLRPNRPPGERERFNLIAAGLYEASTLLGVCEPRNTPLLHLPLRKCSDGLSAFLQTRSQSPPVSEPAAIHGGPPRQQSCEPGPMFGAAKLGKMGADRIDHCGLLAWTPPVGNSPKAHKTMARSHDRPVVLPPGRA